MRALVVMVGAGLAGALAWSGCGQSADSPGGGGSGAATGAEGGGGAGGQGGGLGGGGGEVAPADFIEACVALQSVRCEAYFRCLEPWAVYQFGSLEQCATDADYCEHWYRPGMDAEALAACAAAPPLADCGEVLSTIVDEGASPFSPEACWLRGDLADGSDCAFGEQCASGFCLHPNGGETACGVCTEPPSLWDPCIDACGPRLACIAGTCVRLGDVGDPCDDTHPCLAQRRCDQGICTPEPAEGDACVWDWDCSFEAPLCGPISSSCEPWGPAQALGGECGVEVGNLCIGALCQIVDEQGSGICVPPKEVGESCESGTYFNQDDNCRVGLECIEGTCRYGIDQQVCP